MAAVHHSGATSRKRIIWLVPPFLLLVLIASCRSIEQHRFEQERKSWKAEALLQIARTSFTNEEIRTEIHQIKHSTPNHNFGWTNEHVLLMTNGEFLVFAFHHGFNNGFIDHLFLAHGTDGRWYYSTCHCCNSLAGVSGDDPPGSITEFARRYSVHEFDGKSDVCLQHTWP